jgi:hypothetical protein
VSRWIRSNALGLVAIFIALGGSAVAAQVAKNTVTSKSIKNGTVASKDVKDDDLTTEDIDESTLNGIQGPQGPRGETGPQGPAGPATGAAGGALTGTYPNPGLAASSVTGANVQDGSLVFGEDVAVRCATGLANGGAIVTGGGGIPATFSGDNAHFEDRFDCQDFTGQQVQVRRTAAGDYCVRFPSGLKGVPIASKGIGTGEAVVATSEVAGGTVCPAPAQDGDFVVQLSTSGGAAIDAPFSIVWF